MRKIVDKNCDKGDREMKKIYRTYADTEVASLYTNVECPYCGNEQQELDMNSCGKTYTIECEKCEKEFEMHFDAS